MAGFSFVADTNFLISVHEEKDNVFPFLDGTVLVSVISEIELLGWYKGSANEKQRLESLLNDCILIDLTPEIKKLTISLRQRIVSKLPMPSLLQQANF